MTEQQVEVREDDFRVCAALCQKGGGRIQAETVGDGRARVWHVYPDETIELPSIPVAWLLPRGATSGDVASD